MVYRFHRAPDLKQKIYNQCVVMNITAPSTSDTTAASECPTPYVNHPDAEIYGMIENPVRNKGYTSWKMMCL